MRIVASSLRRSCAAFAVQTLGAARTTTQAFTATDWDRTSKARSDPCRWLSSSSSSSVNFEPPTPPGTHGTPVFPDVDLTVGASSSQTRNNDPNAVFVVTGASRGLGREFVTQLLTRTKGTIVACCRSPGDCSDLAESNERVYVLPLDLEDQTTIEAAGETLRERYSRVDLLLNVAGILGDAKTTPGPERSISGMSRSWFERTMAINLIGPVMFTKELFPLLKQSRRKNERPKSIVANLSARVGSISDNQMGGWYSYRMSKSALNQATRTMALEFKRHDAMAIALHPGTTKTDLSEPFQRNVKEGSLFPVEFTVSQLLQVIESVSEEHSGGLFDWAGKSISF